MYRGNSKLSNEGIQARRDTKILAERKKNGNNDAEEIGRSNISEEMNKDKMK